MRHEPSDSRPTFQPTADRRCPSCRAVKPLDHFPTGAPAGDCGSCRRRTAAIGRRHRQRALRQLARRAEAGYRALLARDTEPGGGGGAA